MIGRKKEVSRKDAESAKKGRNAGAFLNGFLGVLGVLGARQSRSRLEARLGNQGPRARAHPMSERASWGRRANGVRSSAWPAGRRLSRRKPGIRRTPGTEPCRTDLGSCQTSCAAPFGSWCCRKTDRSQFAVYSCILKWPSWTRSGSSTFDPYQNIAHGTEYITWTFTSQAARVLRP